MGISTSPPERTTGSRGSIARSVRSEIPSARAASAGRRASRVERSGGVSGSSFTQLIRRRARSRRTWRCSWRKAAGSAAAASPRHACAGTPSLLLTEQDSYQSLSTRGRSGKHAMVRAPRDIADSDETLAEMRERVGPFSKERCKPDPMSRAELLLRASRFAPPVGPARDRGRVEIKDWSVPRAFSCALWVASARRSQCASSLCARGLVRGRSAQPRGERVTVRPHRLPWRVACLQTPR